MSRTSLKIANHMPDVYKRQLDNINANTPDASMAKKLATLTAPFICLDGMNEKGVSIAVLTLDSDPTYQQTGKPMIATTLAIRLVLDRAATTAEAVELLSKSDMFASSGRDYHFYITDASGDGRVLEYDCNDPARPLTVPPSRSVTNFFVMYKDNVPVSYTHLDVYKRQVQHGTAAPLPGGNSGGQNVRHQFNILLYHSGNPFYTGQGLCFLIKSKPFADRDLRHSWFPSCFYQRQYRIILSAEDVYKRQVSSISSPRRW